jgi:hypothetical protein
MMTIPSISGVIEGVGFRPTPSNTLPATPVEVRFKIMPLPWPDQTTPAGCQVELSEDGKELFNNPIFGVDPIQALELAVKFVGTLVSFQKP